MKSPELAVSISELIEAGKNITYTYDKFCIYEKINDELYVPFKNILNDYIDELRSFAVNVELSDSEYNRYLYKPRLLAYDIYGSTDLYFVILAINNMFNEKQFDRKKIKMLRKEVLAEALGQIYNSEKEFIEAGNRSAENDNDLSILVASEAESFSQQLMNKYPNTWVEDSETVGYIWYATSEDGEFVQQEETDSNVLIVDFPKEVDFKQAIKVNLKLGSLVLLEGFNELTNTWEEIDKNTFSVSYELEYIIYTHTGSTIGARKVRFTFDEK